MKKNKTKTLSIRKIMLKSMVLFTETNKQNHFMRDHRVSPPLLIAGISL